MKQIKIYDTTLRDGTQAEELNLTSEDKIRIALKLDELGIHYIEGGFPGSNPTDKEFFREIKSYDLKNSKIAAFGSTHNSKKMPETDPGLKAIIETGTEVVTLFGKSWDMHATKALGVSLERNLELIRNSLAYIRPHAKELFFDLEHFFDGFKANREYALACVMAAYEAGADVLVPCDTNGGTLPDELGAILKAVKKAAPKVKIGIHAHNDSELAVANSLEGVRQGAVQVQGTINGYGERCGNANLCSIIPNLELKMGLNCIGPERLALLTPFSRYISETANLRPFLRQPFVGASAFAHKGGIHVSAVVKDSQTYEHIKPEQVGNKQRVLLSDLAGRSNIIFKAKQYGYDLDKDDPAIPELLSELKRREQMGYEYSVADASFELLFHETLGQSKDHFEFLNFFVVDAKRQEDKEPFSEATVIIRVNGQEEHTAAKGMGPVSALDNALRKGLERFYPSLSEVKLTDFRVRVLPGVIRDTGGTASHVRVLIESSDKHNTWTTVGVSFNIIEACWRALTDSINYKLYHDELES